MKIKFVRSTFIIMAIAGTLASVSAVTMADAQKAYVSGNWKTAAANFEQVCPTLADSAQAECVLWNILALSQTGVAADFSKAGKRLDSLISQTNPQKAVYADLMMTKAQFQLYLGRHDRAAEALIHAIETSQPRHAVVLQKVCAAVQSKTNSDLLNENCQKLGKSGNVKAEPQPAAPVETAAQAPLPQKSATALPDFGDAQPTSSVQAVPGEAWILQLGVFSVKDNATLLSSNLKKRGINAKIETSEGTDKIRYIVQIEGFNSKEAAVDFAAQKLAPLKIDFQPKRK